MIDVLRLTRSRTGKQGRSSPTNRRKPPNEGERIARQAHEARFAMAASPGYELCRQPKVMTTEIHRNDVVRLRDAGAQLVEVLPEEEYRLEHLPGAVNLPLKEVGRHTADHLRPDTPIIVYCNDGQ